VAARRAVVRWAWRLFRREWRQQILVLALLTLPVAGATAGMSLASGWAVAYQQADLGLANQVVTFYSPDPEEVEADIAAVEEAAGTVDVIARHYLALPGTAAKVELRAQDPDGPYGGALLALREGRYPSGQAEVAVTDGVASRLDLAIGSELGAGTERRTVVGLVENPLDLTDEFALADGIDEPDTLTILLVAGPDERVSFDAPHEGSWSQGLVGGPSPEVVAGMAVLAITTVAMALIALVAVAGFVVTGQRRLRQLGLLAAIGATERHLRLAMIAEGAVIGASAAVLGAAAGLGLSITAAPALEAAVEARIDRFDLPPWWLVGFGMLLSVTAATAAAWWPARLAARVPVTRALTGRAPRSRPGRRPVAAAGFCLVTGVAYLLLAGDPDRGAGRLLLVGGTLAVIAGVLLLGSPAIRLLAAGAGKLPVGPRLALRDLARHLSRSAAALAAITLALGIAVATIVATTVWERTAEVGNLSESQLLVTEQGGRIRELVTLRDQREIDQQRIQVEQLAAAIDNPVVIPLEMAVDPARQPTPGRGPGNSFKPAVLIGDGPLTADPGPLFVASPALLRYYDIDPAGLDPAVEVITVQTGAVGLRYLIEEEVVGAVERLDVPAYRSAPTSLLTLEGMRRRGWEQAHAGWLIDAGGPLTGAQQIHAGEAAQQAGLQVETRDGADLGALRSIRSAASVAGLALALALLVMTVGMVRSEAAGDLRILTATGATSTIRRSLTAVTAGSLALLGAVLGAGGAYLVMASLVSDRAALLPPPVRHLAVIAVAVPAVAALGGWLVSGREPADVARQPMD
jgi:putative ABC transport system permease protein